ncbi:type I DNA topoisomerase [Patescibacteria group bacterium]|nr:type I DNA topoisomerase [Patescibacteria group bacterium]
MKLLIVESPAKAKTIEKYLGSEYRVEASIGHIRDLPKSNKKAIDIDGGFIPHYEISKGKEKIIKTLKSLSREAEEVVLATDHDREGEAIAWHLKEVLGLKNPKRIVFNEITKDAVRNAMENPREIDDSLREAQEARRVLDRIVGYELSGLIWKKLRYGLSAGRVQSPALRIIMEREREIRKFIPEDFWVVTALVENRRGVSFELVCKEEPRDEKRMEYILKIGKQADWLIKNTKESEVKRAPRAPFITSTLQQVASSRLGYSPSNTMRIAQRLYEAGHITYMRTDSTILSATAKAQISEVILKKYGKEYLESRVYSRKSKSAQEAHEAIRPTNAAIVSAGTSPDQKKLYDLIWARTTASQMSSATIVKTKIVAEVKSTDIPDFSISGSRVKFPGWLKADVLARSEDVELPKVKAGEILELKNLDSLAKQTQPLPRYSEAGLVKELEKRGIGRPSTYASTMKTLVDRGYVEKIGKTLFPTDTGDAVSSFLEKYFENYISDSFTSKMESELDEIAAGKRKYVDTLADFYKPFLAEVKNKENVEKITNLGDAPKEFVCPTCKSSMIYKLSRSGKFMSCSKFPDCTGARTVEGVALEGPKETGESCPDCTKGKLMERDGRFGRFVACDKYPKCRYVKQSEEAVKRASTGIKCPVCKVGLPAPSEARQAGEMIERRGRFGVFYSCSSYPKCKYAIKAKPTGAVCEYDREDKGVCNALMMEGTKTIPERCSDKTCPNHNPHKLTKLE